MRGLERAAAAALIACLAFPAAAQAQAARGAGKKRAAHAAARPVRHPDPLQILTAAERDGRGGIAQRNTRFRELQEPQGAFVQGPMRSVPVAANAEFGVGILSVVGETEKRTIRQRTDPRIDVTPGRTRMAGAGLAIRF